MLYEAHSPKMRIGSGVNLNWIGLNKARGWARNPNGRTAGQCPLLRGRATSQTWRYGPAPNTKRFRASLGSRPNSPVQTRVNPMHGQYER